MLRATLRTVLLVTIAGGGAGAQEPPAPAMAQAVHASVSDPPEEEPVSLERIRRGLDRTPAITIAEDIPRFYVEVERELPRLEHFFPGSELSVGPAPYGGMTHSEFLAMVTPQDLFSSAGITAFDTLTVGVTSKLIEWLFKQWREASTEQEIRQIRARIQRELEDLERARARMPSPPR
jgi:hypothetical protein